MKRAWKYRPDRLDVVLIALVALLPAVVLLGRLPRAGDPDPGPEPAPGEARSRAAEAEPPPDLPRAEPAPPSDDPRLPFESEADRLRLLNAQVEALRQYAREADEDDPFALSPEEIEAFYQAGEPIVW